MRPFLYEAPTSIQDAVAILSENGDRARPLAGGTDLLVQLRRSLFSLDVVVDIKQIPELNQLSFDADTGLTVGSAVSCAQLCEHPDVRRVYPGLVDAAGIIGGPAIQSRATLGGNLCNAAPSADAIPAMMVLGATCEVVGPCGTRSISVDAFCIAPGKTLLADGELLVSIHFPIPKPRTGACYQRFTPRREMDIAVAGSGVWLALDDDGTTIRDARVALSAVAPTPLRADKAAETLIGCSPDTSAFSKAAEFAQQAAQPISDVRGTAAQRRHLIGTLTRRALHIAAQRAKGA